MQAAPLASFRKFCSAAVITGVIYILLPSSPSPSYPQPNFGRSRETPLLKVVQAGAQLPTHLAVVTLAAARPLWRSSSLVDCFVGLIAFAGGVPALWRGTMALLLLGVFATPRQCRGAGAARTRWRTYFHTNHPARTGAVSRFPGRPMDGSRSGAHPIAGVLF